MKEVIRGILVENLCLTSIVDNRSPIAADSDIYILVPQLTPLVNYTSMRLRVRVRVHAYSHTYNASSISRVATRDTYAHIRDENSRA